MAETVAKIMEILEKLKEFNISVNVTDEISGRKYIELKIPRSRITLMDHLSSAFEGLVMSEVFIRNNDCGSGDYIGDFITVDIWAKKFEKPENMRITVERVKGNIQNWPGCFINGLCVTKKIAEAYIYVFDLSINFAMDKKYFRIMMWIKL